jgi:hypothetical protein
MFVVSDILKLQQARAHTATGIENPDPLNLRREGTVLPAAGLQHSDKVYFRGFNFTTIM